MNCLLDDDFMPQMLIAIDASGLDTDRLINTLRSLYYSTPNHESCSL